MGRVRGKFKKQRGSSWQGNLENSIAPPERIQRVVTRSTEPRSSSFREREECSQPSETQKDMSQKHTCPNLTLHSPLPLPPLSSHWFNAIRAPSQEVLMTIVSSGKGGKWNDIVEDGQRSLQLYSLFSKDLKQI